MPSTNNNSHGFTLIELLIVILVIGVLSGVLLGVVNSSGVRAKARDSQRKSDLTKIQTALELYFADNRAYPETAGSGSWEYIEGSTDSLSASINPGSGTKYLDPVPVDPSQAGTTNDLCTLTLASLEHNYFYKSDSNTYVLATLMEVSSSNDDSPCADVSHGCGSVPVADYCYAVDNP
jgi:prepilin-type N-terminal cleavage/methylation domain-containing protein